MSPDMHDTLLNFCLRESLLLPLLKKLLQGTGWTEAISEVEDESLDARRCFFAGCCNHAKVFWRTAAVIAGLLHAAHDRIVRFEVGLVGQPV